MKKKIFSLLAVLLVAATAFATFVIVKSNGTLARTYGDQLKFEQNGSSYTLNGVDVKDIACIQNKVWDSYGEYERGFLKGYLDSKYYTYDRKNQITSKVFKEMLKTVIEKHAQESMSYFNSRVSDVDIPLTRNIAVGMVYYAAICIGVDNANRESRPNQPEDFWEGGWEEKVNQVLPHSQDEPSPGTTIPEGKEWQAWQEIMQAYMWNYMHVSPYSNIEVIALDKAAQSYHWLHPFTFEDAVLAITRLYDSFVDLEQEIVYAAIDDPRVTNPDETIITPELIALAAKKEVDSIDKLPRLYGMPMGPEHMPGKKTGTGFDETGADVRQIARWGFNSITFRAAYWHFFTDDDRANLNTLGALDELIAASMEYGVHFNFVLSDIPCRGMRLQDNVHDDYIMDNDILNPDKREKARKIWNTLAKRYINVPNINLSFTTVLELETLTQPTSWGEGRAYTNEEIFEFQDFLFDAVREIDSKRFMFCNLLESPNPTGHLDDDEIRYKQLVPQYQHVIQKYKNIRPQLNLMDLAFSFYSYNTGDGNIDYAMHSIWVPHYPVTLYAAEPVIRSGKKLAFNGFLPRGTKIVVYLASAAGTLTAKADGKDIHEESFASMQKFNVGYKACFGHPYAKSDKEFKFELTEDTKVVEILPGSDSFEWSGIDVVLPESHAVERWRRDTQWDVDLGIIKPEDYNGGAFYKRATSTIEIAPTAGDGGTITIYDNVTYTTEHMWMASDLSVFDHYGSCASKNYGRWAQRVEGIVCSDYESNLKFYEDLAKTFQKYNADVWLPFYGQLFEETFAPYQIAGYKGEDFEGHHNFNLGLLRVLQKYQDK
ncbi:MAG: hypothetical protein IJQ04_00100 [Prevotella sp.]|nr:hypothetical protein [Prevotella sp.]